MTNFDDMMDEEIKAEFRRLAIRIQRSDNPVQAFKSAALEEFGCQNVRITFSKPFLGLRMHMGVVVSPNTRENLDF